MMTTVAARAQDPRLANFFRALDSAGVEWCLLRPPEALAERQGDVDVLVAPASIPLVRRVVTRAGFGLLPRGGCDLHAVEYDQVSDALLWVHIQPQVSLHGRTIPARPILGAVVRDPLPRPADQWLFWILLLNVLEKRAIAERHRASLQRLAVTGGVERCPLADFAARIGVAPERAIAHARAGQWDLLVGTAALRRPSLRARVQGRLRWLRDCRRAERARGLTVAVLGPDGAGKTTLVTSLSRTLPLPTRTVYMGLTGGLMPLADALRIPGLVLAAKLVILSGRYLRGACHRALGRIVIFERYALDGYVPSGIPVRAPGRLSRRVQARVFPSPDLVLLLDASGVTMFKRAHEYDAEQLESWRQVYRRLGPRVSALVVIDAEQTREGVRREAHAQILRRYAETWHPRIA
jgi:thymidylate kinase